MAQAEVTIVIPAYNAEEFIGVTIESALAQEPRPRVIVVDDGSQDRTAELARAYAGVEVVSQPNGGVSAARNAGLALAISSRVIFLDADDALLPGGIAALLEGFAAHPDAVMVFGAYHHMEAGNAITAGSLPHPMETRDPGYVALNVTPGPSQSAYDRAALVEVGGYDEALRSNEDSDLSLRLCSIGTIASHPAFVIARRKHSGQATQRPSRLLRTHLRVLDKHFGEGGLYEDPQLLRNARRRWCRYYGQHMPFEFARLLLRREFSELRGFVSSLAIDAPMIARGMVGGVMSRLSGSHRKRRRTEPIPAS